MSSDVESQLPVPTRAAGLERLAAFLPQAGRAYAKGRNQYGAAGSRQAVSGLSPWLRHRLVTETEVLEAVLREHTRNEASKFIEELFAGDNLKLEPIPANDELFGSEINGEEIRIGLHLAQEELAQLLGASRQRVNQELKAMERENAIRIEPGGLVIRNRDALLRISEADD